MSSRFWSGLVGALVLVLATAYAAWCLHAYRDFVHDDAFITLRYVANLIDGHGLVWNPGERVEGYTSLAAVLAIAIPGLFGADLVFAARLVNALAVAGLVVYSGWFFRDRGVAMGAALILVFPPLLLWVPGGLEAPLFAAAVAIACGETARLFERDRADRRDLRAALLLGLLALVRPDGVVFGAIAGILYVARCARAKGPRARPILLFAGVGLVPAALHLAIRLAYYGSILPNTVVAKTIGQPPVDHFSGGLDYVQAFASSAIPVAVGALAVVVMVFVRRSSRMPVAFLGLSTLVYAGFVIKAGGDHMPGYRLMLPAYPLIVLILRYAPVFPRRFVAPAVFGVVLVAQGLVSGAPRYQPTDAAAFVGRIVGEHIDRVVADGSLVALNTAGATPYFARNHRFIDMLGLNDAEIAAREIHRVTVPWQQMPGHAKGDGHYVLSREPDLIILGPAEGSPANQPWFLSDWEIVQDRRFRASYRERVTELDATKYPGFELQRATRSGRLRVIAYERVE